MNVSNGAEREREIWIVRGIKLSGNHYITEIKIIGIVLFEWRQQLFFFIDENSRCNVYLPNYSFIALPLTASFTDISGLEWTNHDNAFRLWMLANFESHHVEANDLQSVVDQYFQIRGTSKPARHIETHFGINKELIASSTKAWLRKWESSIYRCRQRDDWRR